MALAKAISSLVILTSKYRNSTYCSKSFYDVCQISVRSRWNTMHLNLPSAHRGNYRRTIHFPDKYTVKPLGNTHLAGRDPFTGRVVQATVGGGIKHLYHWVDFIRVGPKEPNVPPLKEKVIQILKCGCRSADIALVGVANRLKYIIATEHMQAGDILRTSQYIPPTPVFPNEGDAYPLGALDDGTVICCVEKFPGLGGVLIHAAGSQAVIVRHIDDRVIIRLPDRAELSLKNTCMATVGRVSNVEHSSIPYSSIQEKREAGYRPRSGLFKKKTGRFGRKIKPPPPIKEINEYNKEKDGDIIQLMHPSLNMSYHFCRIPEVMVEENMRLYGRPKVNLKEMEKNKRHLKEDFYAEYDFTK